MKRPAWYLAPYVIALGLQDWLAEQNRVTHSEAIKHAAHTVRTEGYPFLRRVGVGAALLGAAVLWTSFYGAAAMQRLAFLLRPSLYLPLCASLALAGAAVLGGRGALRLLRGLQALYARGIRVLEKREAELLDAEYRP